MNRPYGMKNLTKINHQHNACQQKQGQRYSKGRTDFQMLIVDIKKEHSDKPADNRAD